MQQLPKTWDDVYYLVRKEINANPDLPNFTIDDTRMWSNAFWKCLKKVTKDKSSPIRLNGFLTFYPRLKAIKRYEERKQYKIKQREEKEKLQSTGSNE